MRDDSFEAIKPIFSTMVKKRKDSHSELNRTEEGDSVPYFSAAIDTERGSRIALSSNREKILENLRCSKNKQWKNSMSM